MDVLIVDTSEEVANKYAQYFEDKGYRTTVVSDPETLHEICVTDKTIDLVVAGNINFGRKRISNPTEATKLIQRIEDQRYGLVDDISKRIPNANTENHMPSAFECFIREKYWLEGVLTYTLLDPYGEMPNKPMQSDFERWLRKATSIVEQRKRKTSQESARIAIVRAEKFMDVPPY